MLSRQDNLWTITELVYERLMFLSSSLRGLTMSWTQNSATTCAVETKIEFISDWTFSIGSWQKLVPLVAPAKPERSLQPEYIHTCFHSPAITHAVKSMIADIILVSRCRKFLQWHNFPAGCVNCFLAAATPPAYVEISLTHQPMLQIIIGLDHWLCQWRCLFFRQKFSEIEIWDGDRGGL